VGALGYGLLSGLYGANTEIPAYPSYTSFLLNIRLRFLVIFLILLGMIRWTLTGFRQRISYEDRAKIVILLNKDATYILSFAILSVGGFSSIK